MSRVFAPITPAVMQWARETAKFSLEEAAERLGRSVEELAAWEDAGVEKEPTIAQARKAAELYHRPFAVLFLEAPPRDFAVIADYRRLPATHVRAFSRELIFLMRETDERQQWTREHLLDEEVTPLDFVGAGRVGMPQTELASVIRRRLGIPSDWPSRCASQEEALRFWVRHAEDVGIFVFRNGSIESGEACGFAMCDDLAPFIFLNSNDAASRRLFTLAHELVHIWINQSAVSNLMLKGNAPSPQSDEAETFCNRVAALMLLDPVRFAEELRKTSQFTPLLERVEGLARKFRVSQEVVARRMLDMTPPQITPNDYERIRNYAIQLWRKHRQREEEKRRMLKEQGKRVPGPTFFQTKPSQNGYSFTRTVLSAYYSGRASAGEVYGLLGLAVKHIPQFSEIVGMPIPANWTRK